MTLNRRRTTLSIIVLGVLMSGCEAHLVSTNLPPSATTKTNLDGLYYALPKTVVTASIPVKLTKVEDGKYKDFADVFFGGTNKPSLTFGTPTFSSAGQPDPRQIYVVKGEGSGAIAQTLTFTFSESGAVTGLKAEVDNQTAGLVTSGISAAVGAFGKLHYGQGVSPMQNCVKSMRDDEYFKCEALENREELLAYFAKLDAARRNFLASQYRSSQTYKDEFDEAKTEYLKIMDLVATRTAEIDSFALQTAAPLDEYWARATELIAERTTAFKGKKSEHKWTATVEVEPKQCSAKRESPCTAGWTSPAVVKYEPSVGICSHATLRGDALPASMRAACTSSAREIKVNFSPNPASDQVVNRVAANFDRPSVAGMHFIVPQRLRVQLVDAPVRGRSSTVLHGYADLMVAQRGIVAALPSSIGGNALTHNLQFYEASGALKNYTLVSKSNATKGVPDSVSASTNSLLDARNKQAAAEASAEFNSLKREAETLQYLLAKQQACAQLANPPEQCN